MFSGKTVSETIKSCFNIDIDRFFVLFHRSKVSSSVTDMLLVKSRNQLKSTMLGAASSTPAECKLLILERVCSSSGKRKNFRLVEERELTRTAHYDLLKFVSMTQ